MQYVIQLVSLATGERSEDGRPNRPMTAYTAALELADG